jgi:hypothetical protein
MDPSYMDRPIYIEAAMRRRMRGVLTPKESAEEDKFVRACRERSWRTRKLNGEGQRDWPDRLVCLPLGLVALIEFKRRGKKATGKQDDKHTELRALSHHVLVCDTAQEALQYCDELVKRQSNGVGSKSRKTLRLLSNLKR